MLYNNSKNAYKLNVLKTSEYGMKHDKSIWISKFKSTLSINERHRMKVATIGIIYLIVHIDCYICHPKLQIWEHGPILAP